MSNQNWNNWLITSFFKWQNHLSKYNCRLKYVPCSDFLKYKLYHFWRQWNLEKLNLMVLLLQWFYPSTSFSITKCHICTTGLRNAAEDPTVKLYGLLDANVTRTAMSAELNQSAWNSLRYRVSFLSRRWAGQLHHIKVCLSQDIPWQVTMCRDIIKETPCTLQAVCLALSVSHTTLGYFFHENEGFQALV
jgi:hypothetical protein